MSRLCTLAALGLLTFPLCARADELLTLGNKTIKGTVVAVSDKEITLKTDSGLVTTPLAEVLALDLTRVKGVPANTKYIDVKLLDDTVLHCSKVTYKGGNAQLTLLSGQEIKLSLKNVVWILNDAHDATIQKEWSLILADKETRRDRAVILKAAVLNGIPGTFGDVNPDGSKIQFRIDGTDKIGEISFTRLQGLVFHRTEGPTKSPVCLVYDVEGNNLAAVNIVLKDGKYHITTAAGIEVALDQKNVARFDYNLGKQSFLSDIAFAKEPIFKSAVGLPVAVRRDTNLDGEPIVLGDKSFPKGLSLHAYTEIEYDLGGKYKEFNFTLGVDARTGAEGKARVLIEVDGRKLFDETMTAAMPPAAHTLNLRGGTRLRIVVSSTNLLDLHDHVTIANPQIRQ